MPHSKTDQLQYALQIPQAMHLNKKVRVQADVVGGVAPIVVGVKVVVVELL